MYLIHVIEAGVAWNKLIIRQLVVITLSNLQKAKEIINMSNIESKVHHTFSPVRVRLVISQSTRPNAYMSAALKDSMLDLLRVSSSTSGAM